jgi:hypothetical protein
MSEAARRPNPFIFVCTISIFAYCLRANLGEYMSKASKPGISRDDVPLVLTVGDASTLIFQTFYLGKTVNAIRSFATSGNRVIQA